MKYIIKYCFAILFIHVISETGLAQILCGTDLMIESLDTSQYEAMVPDCPDLDGIQYTNIEIPVIVHALYDNEFENVNYEDVLEMIENANDQLATEELVDDRVINISLKLANTGTCTPGFERVYLEDPFIHSDGSDEDLIVEEQRVKLPSLWPADKYLNIWIVEEIVWGNDLIGGYSWVGFNYFPPLINSLVDGIVLDDEWLSALIHEFGHYADLYHPWEKHFKDACDYPFNTNFTSDCTSGDLIEETPPVKGPIILLQNYTCEDYLGPCVNHLGLATIGMCHLVDCGAGTYYFNHPVFNYMNYSEPCWSEFTEGQYIRMVSDFNDRRLSLIENNPKNYIVNLSSNEDHTVNDLLGAMGLSNLNELCDNTEQYVVEIGGNLILNQGPSYPVCFGSGTTILMQPGAKITLTNNSSLSFDDVHVFGCEDYWDYIFVEDGSTLTVGGESLIEHGWTAIKAEKNAIVNISSSTFNNNHVSISLLPDGTGNGTKITLTDCVFTSDEEYLPVLGSLELKPYAGVVVIGQEYVNLSADNGTRNTYSGLSNGILADASNISVKNSDFTNIFYTEPPPPTKTHVLHRNGYAIRIRDSEIPSHLYNNTILNTEYGIGVLNGRPVVISNVMRNVEQGIILLKVDNMYIHHNGIEATDRGIYVGFSMPLIDEVAFHIEDNTVSIISSSSKAKAIEIEYCQKLNVLENPISILTNDGGIFVRNSFRNLFELNNITVNSPGLTKTDALYLANTSYCIANDNTLNDATSTNKINDGIYAVTSPRNTWSCNIITDFNHGMQFWDNCEGSKLLGNTYNSNQTDLVLGIADQIGQDIGASWIGIQGSLDQHTGNGNLWPFQNSLAHNSAEEDIVAWSLFYVNTVPSSHYLPDIIEADGNWFEDDPSFSNLDPCNENPQYDPFVNLYGADIINKFTIVDTMSGIDICKKNMWKWAFFKELLWLEDQDSLDDISLAFLNNRRNDAIVQLADIGLEIDSAKYIPGGSISIYNELVTLVSALDSLFDNGEGYGSTWDQTTLTFNDRLSSYRTSLKQEKFLINNHLTGLETTLSSISITEPCLQVLKDMYTIQLHLFKTDSLTDSESTYVSTVADACPSEYGNGVYLARSMISLEQNERYKREEECIDEIINPRSANYRHETKRLFVFPNPAESKVNIRIALEENEKGFIRVLDMKGNEQFYEEIFDTENTLELNSGSYAPGVYLVKFLSSSGKQEMEKLMIVR